MNIASKLHALRVVIVTHEYATGPSHALETYLQGKVSKLAFIAHPFVFAKEKRSHIRESTKKEYFFPFYIPIQFLNLVKDVFLTFIWCLRFGSIDLYVGVDNVNASVGAILQKIGLVQKTVFYTIDYIPNRHNNKFLNTVYHKLDAFAVKNVDVIWNLSSIMADEREKVGLSSLKIRYKQLVVPMGTDAMVSSLPFTKIKRYHAAHMGHLIRKQGVQRVIEAIPIILKRIPRFHLDIIGGGPMEQELLRMVHTLRLKKHVTFYGFIKNHDEVETLLSRCAVAVAPYVDSPDNFVRFTDPGKVKAYLSVGLPIVITKVPDVWKILVGQKAGIAVSDTPDALAKAIIILLSDDKKLQQYRHNALLLGQKFSWNNIFTQAVSKTV